MNAKVVGVSASGDCSLTLNFYMYFIRVYILNTNHRQRKDGAILV